MAWSRWVREGGRRRWARKNVKFCNFKSTFFQSIGSKTRSFDCWEDCFLILNPTNSTFSFSNNFLLSWIDLNFMNFVLLKRVFNHFSKKVCFQSFQGELLKVRNKDEKFIRENWSTLRRRRRNIAIRKTNHKFLINWTLDWRHLQEISAYTHNFALGLSLSIQCHSRSHVNWHSPTLHCEN